MSAMFFMCVQLPVNEAEFLLKAIPHDFAYDTKYSPASPWLSLVKRENDKWFVTSRCVIALFQEANSVERPTIADLDNALAQYVWRKMRL